jgi:hypothetical protein
VSKNGAGAERQTQADHDWPAAASTAPTGTGGRARSAFIISWSRWRRSIFRLRFF